MLREYELDAANAHAPFAISAASQVVGVMLQPILPVRFSVLVGEVCYNLRAALEYLVYELARHDSGAVQRGTQFPIEDDPARFACRKDPADRRFVLPGIDAANVAMIERLQPYNGAQWTGALRDRSNQDRHRELNATQAWTQGGPVQSNVPFNNGRPEIRRGRDGRETYVQFPITVSVLFDDGVPVVQMLEGLQREVAQALGSFGSAF